jgi:hypothetical protein
MPGFDGTGPRGQGPMTGRGEGYCAVRLPDSGEPPYGYAGVQGTPVRPRLAAVRPGFRTRLARWIRPALGFRRGFRGGRGRGRRFGRW